MWLFSVRLETVLHHLGGDRCYLLRFCTTCNSSHAPKLDVCARYGCKCVTEISTFNAHPLNCDLGSWFFCAHVERSVISRSSFTPQMDEERAERTAHSVAQTQVVVGIPRRLEARWNHTRFRVLRRLCDWLFGTESCRCKTVLSFRAGSHSMAGAVWHGSDRSRRTK